jgi:hypothetical protein
MSKDAKCAAGHGAARKDEPCGLVFREISVGVIVVYVTVEQARGTRKTMSLAANNREVNSIFGSSIENVLVGGAFDGAASFGRFQDNPKAPLLCHLGLDATN